MFDIGIVQEILKVNILLISPSKQEVKDTGVKFSKQENRLKQIVHFLE